MQNPNELELITHFCSECGDFRILTAARVCMLCHAKMPAKTVAETAMPNTFNTDEELAAFIASLTK